MKIIYIFFTASLLLNSLVGQVTTPERSNCKVIYLHVLTTNFSAIKFYEKRNFRLHKFLPYYYTINGQNYDGYCYALYVNGGRPEYSFVYPFSDKYQILFFFIERFYILNFFINCIFISSA